MMKQLLTTAVRRGAWLSPVVLLLGAASVSAQPAAPADSSAAAGGADVAAAAAANQISEVVITGSRLEVSGYSAPTPVAVMTQADLQERNATSIPNALIEAPQFAGSVGDQANAVGATGQRGTYLNLRSLGADRTLILQDGVRVPPTTADGGVDANLLPQMLIQRVDVVTGGASAAYGSDAVSGVVNFVIDKNFNGLKGVAQVGTSKYEDKETWKLGVAAGRSFLDGRLHLEGSYEHSMDEGVASHQDRPFTGGSPRWISVGTGSQGAANNPYVLYGEIENDRWGVGPGVLLSTNNSWQGILRNAAAGIDVAFEEGGGWHDFNYGVRVANGVCTDCDGGRHAGELMSLTPRTMKDQAYGRVDFDLTDSVKVWGDVSWARNQIRGSQMPLYLFSGQMTIYRENAFLPDDLRARFGSAPSAGFGRNFPEFGGMTWEHDNKLRKFGAGLTGELPNGWNWDASIVNGVAKVAGRSLEPNILRLTAATDAVDEGEFRTGVRNGNVVCRVELTNPGLYPGCTPINLFGFHSPSQAAIDYVKGAVVWHTRTEMTIYQANLRGDIWELPAGSVAAAVGAEYRTQELTQTTNNDAADRPDLTGLRGQPPGYTAYFTALGAAQGEVNVKEVYGEILVPILRDMPLAQSLDLNAAARYTDYSVSGGVTTWKVGATYEPTADIRLRATRSRDIRAPGLYELFGGTSQGGPSLYDPLTNTQGGGISLTRNNPDLKPEIADTWTVGVVYQPEWLSGFSASVDYFKIDMSDAIANPYSVQEIMDLCGPTGQGHSLCSQIVRPFGLDNRTVANRPSYVILQPLNVASVKVDGIDFEASYHRELGPGTLGARLLASRLLHYTEQASPDDDPLETAGVTDLPKWRGNVEVNYQTGPLRAALLMRFYSKTRHAQTGVWADPDDAFARPYQIFDANFSYKFGTDEEYEAFLQIKNLTDKKPPFTIVGSGAIGNHVGTNFSLYDAIGRYYTAGVRFNF
jgi:outer membrane receptor protein involved in Fe transport